VHRLTGAANVEALKIHKEQPNDAVGIYGSLDLHTIGYLQNLKNKKN